MTDVLGSHRIIGLIPARAGSKRVPGKNTRELGGVPLVVRAIRSAQESRIFSTILVSTDDHYAAQLAWQAGAGVHDRKPDHATDDSPDIEWVRDVMTGREEDMFAILRPTTPFRTAAMIRRGYARLVTADGAHSVRAVCRAREHPAKMWREISSTRMVPVLDGRTDQAPWHSLPTQGLDIVYRQTAGLEVAWSWVLARTGTISGSVVCPLHTDCIESLDVNTPEDWAEAERVCARLDAGLCGCA